jgi:hypothetical protein
MSLIQELEIKLANEFLHFMYEANKNIRREEMREVPADVMKAFFMAGGRAMLRILAEAKKP